MRLNSKHLVLLGFIALLWPDLGWAAAGKIEAVGLGSTVPVKRAGALVHLKAGDFLESGDELSTDAQTAVDIRLDDDSLLRVGLSSTYQVKEETKLHFLVHRLLLGAVRVLVPKNKEASSTGDVKFRLYTPEGTVGVRGTEFEVVRTAGKTQLSGFSGEVLFGPAETDFADTKKFVVVSRGFRSSVETGKLPLKPEKFSLAEASAQMTSSKGLFSPLAARGKGANVKLRAASRTGTPASGTATTAGSQGKSKAAPETARPGMSPNYQAVLLAAAEAGDLARAQLAIANKANVNARDGEGETPLILASRKGHLEMMKLLLRSGAKVDAPSADKVTPLYFAVSAGNLSAVEILLDAKADVNARDNEGHSPLLVAVMLGEAKKADEGDNRLLIIQQLIQHKANVNQADNDGRTPLMQAAGEKNFPLPVVELLVENGADPASTDPSGATALSLAQESGNAAIASFLSGLTPATATSKNKKKPK